jgi:hypothetical protein
MVSWYVLKKKHCVFFCFYSFFFYHSEPYQSYKIPLKNNGQSVIEHNLVTIYLSLEWPNNVNDSPNLLIHIFDKSKTKKKFFFYFL